MAPALRYLFSRRDWDSGAPSAAFANEWSQPSNYAFTILLLLGGDVINRALAQLAGGFVTPVAFSFGEEHACIYLLSFLAKSFYRMGFLRDELHRFSAQRI